MEQKKGSPLKLILVLLVVLAVSFMGIFSLLLVARGLGGLIDKPTGKGAATLCSDLGYANIDSNKTILERIAKNKPVYEKAADKHGIPWEMLAALHYREHQNLNDNPSNGEGPFQLYSLKQSNPNHPALSNFEAAADFAANALKSTYAPRYSKHVNKELGTLSLSSPNELIQGSFWAYNGLVATLDVSPYVWNLFDGAHSGPDGKGMLWPSEHSMGGRKDSNDGAFTVYSFLRYGSDFDGKTFTAKTCVSTTLIAGENSNVNTEGFSQPLDDFKKFVPLKPHHKGYQTAVAVDIPVIIGTKLYAIYDGRISNIFIGSEDCGNGVRLTMNSPQTGELNVLYCHMDQVGRGVITGSSVKAGQFIGTSGNTGRSTGPHLHLQGEGGFLEKFPPPAGAENSDRERQWRLFLESLAK